MSANDRQVAGSHYKQDGKPQHWDLVVQYEWDYFQGQVVKYLMRWKAKNGLQDLEKAQHFLEKYIEEVKAGRIDNPKAVLKVGGSPTLAPAGGMPVADNAKFQAERSQDDAKEYGLQVEGYYGDGDQEYTCLRTRRRVRAKTPQAALALLAATPAPATP